MVTEVNKQRTNIKFTTEKDNHKSINFLNLTRYRKRTKLEFAIHRKPT
jgi:hypothetical protein